MKVLVIGSGGREHALVWKIAQSPRVDKVYCAPGNAGIAHQAECVPIEAEDVKGLLNFALEQSIDLTVVGPENALTQGIVDQFTEKGLSIFGPTKAGAQLEGSKSFSKNLMVKYGIPTAQGKSFTNMDKALKHLSTVRGSIVIKADGLAAGKGVIVCRTSKQAREAVTLIMKDKAFGSAGSRCVIEECLVGEEASFIAFTDGKTVLPLPSSQDHKAVQDGDKGPNTGGMGAYSPAPVVDEFLHEKVMKEIMEPTVAAMSKEGCLYKGMLYAGLMISQDQVKVLEFNCRFGDPEAQPLLARLQTDLVDIMEAVIDERLDEITLDIDPRPAVCVVMASKGYPGSYEKGKVIKGLEKAGRMKDVVVFHAGTSFDENDKVATSGGRVLGVTALGDSTEKAISKAYDAVEKIKWSGSFYRKDIGKKALDRKKEPPQVLILMGSDSDLPVMKATSMVLRELRISHEITVASAHRTPEKAASLSQGARKRGIKVIIAGAGAAAHLAGAMAAHTTLPVIGVPIDATPLNGMDALLSTVQMPPGIPVACMAVGKMGAKNAAILAAQIIGVSDEQVAKRLFDHRLNMAVQVQQKAKAITRRV